MEQWNNQEERAFRHQLCRHITPIIWVINTETSLPWRVILTLKQVRTMSLGKCSWLADAGHWHNHTHSGERERGDTQHIYPWGLNNRGTCKSNGNSISSCHLLLSSHATYFYFHPRNNIESIAVQNLNVLFRPYPNKGYQARQYCRLGSGRECGVYYKWCWYNRICIGHPSRAQ